MTVRTWADPRCDRPGFGAGTFATLACAFVGTVISTAKAQATLGGDMTLTHVRGGHQYSLMARHTLRGGDRSRGALQFDWCFPIHKNFRGHLEIFHGYGESLIDYNHKATYVGLGISLLEWF